MPYRPASRFDSCTGAGAKCPGKLLLAAVCRQQFAPDVDKLPVADHFYHIQQRLQLVLEPDRQPSGELGFRLGFRVGCV